MFLGYLMFFLIIYGIVYVIIAIITFPFNVTKKIMSWFHDLIELAREKGVFEKLGRIIAPIVAYTLFIGVIAAIVATIATITIIGYFIAYIVEFTGRLTAKIGLLANKIKIIRKIEAHYDLLLKNLYIKLWQNRYGRKFVRPIINYLHIPTWLLYTGMGKIPFYLFFGWIFIPLMLVFELIARAAKLNENLAQKLAQNLQDNTELLQILKETPQFGRWYHSTIRAALGISQINTIKP